MGQFAQRRNLSHVLSNVQVRFSCHGATSCACSALDALKEFVFLGKLLSVHVVRHFLMEWEHKIIKVFSRESSETNHQEGDSVSGKEAV
jgi:hypothetical protein